MNAKTPKLMPDRETLLTTYQTALAAEARRRAVENAKYDWRRQARPKQLAPPGDWRVWLLLAGRGFGKTRSGAEWVRALATTPNQRIALVGATAADVRDVMVEGPSGILAVCRPAERPIYEPSKRRVTWANGSVATTYSADEPDRLRGPQHTAAWVDELATWRYPDAWDMLMFGLRMGTHPRALVTTTPRPTPIVKQLAADPTTRLVTGSSYENRANLSPIFFERIVAQYEGTRLGRQEIEAAILDDVPGALWSHQLIEATRVQQAPELTRIVVAIDPAVTSGEDADETGIVVAGRTANGHGYVLADVSGRMQPIEWARAAIAAYRTHHADRIVAEVNNGGEMVEATLRMIDPNVPYTAVHATRGKVVRAEPVAALYEQGRAHHVGAFAKLEDQMCSFTTDLNRKLGSPDRVDALTWALTELLVEPLLGAAFFELTRQRAAALATNQRPASPVYAALGSQEYLH